jgi:hypothetical protein
MSVSNVVADTLCEGEPSTTWLGGCQCVNSEFVELNLELTCHVTRTCDPSWRPILAAAAGAYYTTAQ